MRKLFVLIALLFVVAPLVQAQHLQVFGGYSYVRFRPMDASGNFNGWNISATAKMFKMLGATADFGQTNGTYAFGIDNTLTTFLFGPEVRLRTRVSPFAHALFGEAHVPNGGVPHTDFSWAIGGGIDIYAKKLIGFRLIQAEYLHTNFDLGQSSFIFLGTHQENLRISTGLTLRF